MLGAADEETETNTTLSLELLRSGQSISGRTRFLSWELDLKAFSLNFFFEERILVNNIHFLGTKFNEVLSESESLIVKTEESFLVVFTMEVLGTASGCEPKYTITPSLDVLYYELVSFG